MKIFNRTIMIPVKIKLFKFDSKIFFLLVYFSFTVSYAQNIYWKPEQQVGFDTVNLTGARVFAFGDTVHVFWQQYIEQGNRAYYIRSTDGGDLFSPPRTVWADSGVLQNSGSTQHITVHNNYIYVLWSTCDTCDSYRNWATFRRSTDAGVTFEPFEKLFPAAFAISITAYDSLVAFIWSDRTLTEYWLALSFDHGSTWQNIPSQFQYFQKLHLAGNHLHLTEAAEGTVRLEVAYRYSSDFGTTWTNQHILSTVDNYGSDASSVASVATIEGNVYVDWTDGKYGGTNPFVGSNLIRHSTDIGVNWQSEVVLTDTPSSISPSVSIEGGVVGIVWNNESQPFQGISLRISTDSGATWLPHIAVSDSSRPAAQAEISISRQKIYIVWADRRTALSQIYLRSGKLITTGVADDQPTLPVDVRLHPNYPNPFNAITIISYEVPQRMNISLSVFNILGREVRELFNGIQESGRFRIPLDASGLSSGVYFVRLVTDQHIIVRPIMLIR
jgi:hypothetical protein